MVTVFNTIHLGVKLPKARGESTSNSHQYLLRQFGWNLSILTQISNKFLIVVYFKINGFKILFREPEHVLCRVSLRILSQLYTPRICKYNKELWI